MKSKKIKSSTKFSLAILFSILIVFAFVWSHRYSRYSELLKSESEIQQKIDDQIEFRVELLKEKNYMTTDAYIEDIARKQLNMIKPNEMIIVNKNKVD